MKHGILQAKPPKGHTDKGILPEQVPQCCPGLTRVSASRNGNGQVRCSGCGVFVARMVRGLAYLPPRAV